MNSKPAIPKEAASIILLDYERNRVLWAKRNPKLRFLGGFHSFAGGKVDETDALADVRNCHDPEMKRMIACGVRENFEEIGVLLVRNGDRLTSGQIVSLHDDLISGRSTLAEILKHWNLWIDAEDFIHSGFWTTPEFSPMRFKTHFFIAVCPKKQIPYRAITELQEIEFIDPGTALNHWRKSKVLIAPPVLITLEELTANPTKEGLIDLDDSAKNLLSKSEAANGNLDFIELNSRLICMPLRTKTLPPATHTNCFIVGKKKFVVIDAATPQEDEQQKLFSLVDELIEEGCECEAIIVSHLHPDHFGGENALRDHLLSKYGIKVSISAHKITAESLKGKVEIVTFIEDEQSYDLEDENGEPFALKALHTPGHARGHLCFYDEEFGFLLSSDNVVGIGTVVIAPPEGNMSDYFDSLERMNNLPGLNFLCGSHGVAVYDGKGRVEKYIEHRLMRENQILEVVRQGEKKPDEIVTHVYPDLDPRLIPLAILTIEAHLEKLRSEDRISE